ncbi:hypothetical protein ACP70R_000182 [Stipagrostis hirtigluma subsp. patula]
MEATCPVSISKRQPGPTGLYDGFRRTIGSTGQAEAKRGPNKQRSRSRSTLKISNLSSTAKDAASFPDDGAETPSARSRASNGELVLVCFRLVAPPAASRLYLHYLREAEEFNETALVAAHRDSVLFRVVDLSGPVDSSFPCCCHTDYFVCKAGGSSGLSLAGPLLPCYVDERQMAGQGRAVHSHMLRARDIGLLRRGEEEFAVADLMMSSPEPTERSQENASLARVSP